MFLAWLLAKTLLLFFKFGIPLRKSGKRPCTIFQRNDAHLCFHVKTTAILGISVSSRAMQKSKIVIPIKKSVNIRGYSTCMPVSQAASQGC